MLLLLLLLLLLLRVMMVAGRLGPGLREGPRPWAAP